MDGGALIYCPAAPPGSTSALHWQEAHRPTPPVAQPGGAPYKEVKYLPPDKCAYPPITAYHKLAAPGPCMDCVCTSAKLQEGSAVVRSTSQDLQHLSHNCRVTHLKCLEINPPFIYSPNVLVITFSLLFKGGFLQFYDRYVTCLAAVTSSTCKWVIRLYPPVCRVSRYQGNKHFIRIRMGVCLDFLKFVQRGYECLRSNVMQVSVRPNKMTTLSKYWGHVLSGFLHACEQDLDPCRSSHLVESMINSPFLLMEAENNTRTNEWPSLHKWQFYLFY